MEPKINYKPDWLSKLQLLARVTSLILIFFWVLMVMFMEAMLNRPAPVKDYIILASFSIYVIGLLIGFKWEGLGGLISSSYLVLVLINTINGNFNAGFYVWILVFMLPGIFFLLYWYFHRKLDRNHTISKHMK